MKYPVLVESSERSVTCAGNCILWRRLGASFVLDKLHVTVIVARLGLYSRKYHVYDVHILSFCDDKLVVFVPWNVFYTRLGNYDVSKGGGNRRKVYLVRLKVECRSFVDNAGRAIASRGLCLVRGIGRTSRHGSRGASGSNGGVQGRQRGGLRPTPSAKTR